MLRAPRSSRRGVLLLVVLSLLVLFMLIGTAFLMSSNQYGRASKASAKLNRVGNHPTKLLDRAVMQIIRDTENPNSAVRTHSLLRDLYGTDGFEAVVYSPLSLDLTTPAGQVSRFAASTANANELLGPTQGQMIDLYVRALAYDPSGVGGIFSANDPLTPENEANTVLSPDARHVVKLDRDGSGQRQLHAVWMTDPTTGNPFLAMPLTRGFYNGCLLTITSGPAAGQSTRILDYEFVNTMNPSVGGSPSIISRLYRFRVMAFPRSDGSPLRIDPDRLPEIGDLAGATLIVNGRPLNGTGAGYNAFSVAGQPRLTARESIKLGTAPAMALMTAGPDLPSVLYPEIALVPNAAFAIMSDPVPSSVNNADLYGAQYPIPVFNSSGDVVRYDDFLALNPKVPASATPAERAEIIANWKYPTFAGPGDADESYDAADFQNMFLALQTVTPRAQGRVVQPDNTNSPADPDSLPDVLDINDPDVEPMEFLRLDLEDLPLPSFHRPALVNFWYHRLLSYAANPSGGAALPRDAHVRAVLQPYGPDGIREGSPGDSGDDPTAVPLAVRDQIVAIKRKISLRPLREDHPNFDGSNPLSRPTDVSGVAPLVVNGNISVPYWEAVGPWDVDNDNDGVPDSVWVDLGEPVAQAEDGTLYKPLFAFLVMDLDSRLNVNAHGVADNIVPASLAAVPEPLNPGNYVAGPNVANDLSTIIDLDNSNWLPQGLGYGPAEISLRPLLSPLLPSLAAAGVIPVANVGNPAGDANLLNGDDYARLLIGRPGSSVGLAGDEVWGRHGLLDVWGAATTIDAYGNNVKPGITFDNHNTNPVEGLIDRLAALKFFGYPSWLSYYYGDRMGFPQPLVPTAFSSPPDLFGRYAIGVDYTGQPVYEQAADAVSTGNIYSMLHDAPYEVNLSEPVRRDVPDPNVVDLMTSGTAPVISDDAPFATADLERILRSHDADAGILPGRLWNVVDTFDPVKLIQNQPDVVVTFARQMFNDTSISVADEPQMLAAAQAMAGPARRLVTTDSYDLPVPSRNFLGRLIYGADGQPGVAGVDDDGDDPGDGSLTDEPDELGWGGSDDYEPVMKGISIAGPPVAPRITPENPTIVDLLKYRVQYEQRKRGLPNYSEAEMSLIVQYLLPAEVIAGRRMDLNRPFGDGRDNAGDRMDNNGDGQIDEPSEPGDPFVNGVVDDPLEAGEPFVDTNGNGKWDFGERIYDIYPGDADNDGNDYDGPLDRLWDQLTDEPMAFDYNHGSPPVDLNNDGDYNDPLEGLVDGRPIDGNNDGDFDDQEDGRLRYNGIVQRQTMARQLYCLMMLLVDENFIASQNMRPELPADGGVYDVSFLDGQGNFDLFILHQQLALDMALRDLVESNQLNENTQTTSAAFKTLLGNKINEAKPLAYAWVLRKLTARRVAQWAINVVDYRDADSIMTPFEYDENPWDGWGVYATDPNQRNSANDNVFFVPLDGDVATNENWGYDVSPPYAAPKKFDPFRRIEDNRSDPDYNPRNDAEPVLLDGTPEAATRDVVWGVERPELLITETLALHDRRATDENDLQGYPPHKLIGSPPATPSQNDPPDFDLDQRLKPRGSLFVELYNPWSPDGNRPAELYGNTIAGGQQGVMLNRLSEFAAGGTRRRPGKRSPVWRMAVFNEPFSGTLSAQIINPELTDPSAVEQAARQVASVDPDGYGINMDKHAERLVYFTSGPNGGDPNRQDDNQFTTGLVGGLAEYEQVGTEYLPRTAQLEVRVPALPVRWAVVPGSGVTTTAPYAAARRYFIARTERRGTAPNDVDVPIAPILPGRYAVIGSSGLQLTGPGISGSSSQSTADGVTTTRFADGSATRFVTPISRLVSGEGLSNADNYQRENLYRTRRVELWPTIDPNEQQVLIGENGGPEFVRLAGGAVVNVTDSQRPGTPDPPDFGVPDNSIIEPCVAIPVEDLSITEPVEGYPSLLYQKLYFENLPTPTPLPSPAPVVLNGEGELEYSPTFDHPLDLELALVRNGTTPNYRSLHLQRLANPLLPWNPPPYDQDGSENAFHRQELPINPYLTIDSQSVDLTAYNGASQLERSNLPVQPQTNYPQPSMNVSTDPVFQSNFFAPLSVDELEFAPEQVLWALIFSLKQEILSPTGQAQAPIIPKDRWMTPADIRQQLETQTGRDQLQGYLDALQANKIKNTMPDSTQARTALQAARSDTYGREWNGQWGWSLFRRVLPDDQASDNLDKVGSFAQWLHMQSLERGSHDRTYLKYRAPFTSFYKKYDDMNLNAQGIEGWTYDPTWEPRLIWKQDRPNARLFLYGSSTGVVEASDLENATSRRLLQAELLSQKERSTTMADDAIARNQAVFARLKAGTGAGGNRHVVDFVLQQTLGFANESFAPDLDRAGGQDANAIISTVKPGAPEVAVAGSPAYPTNSLPDGNAASYSVPKEVLNAPRRGTLEARQASLLQSLEDNGSAQALADRDVLRDEFYARRQRWMRSTYPWLAWNDRPFANADEIMQVPAWSSSLMLRQYSVINSSTANPYDGAIKDDGSTTIMRGNRTFVDLDGVKSTVYRYNRQQSPFGHLLNFFLTSAVPATAGVNATNAVLTGAPNYYRILDYVEVPSRYVGTDEFLTAEYFNDVPGVVDGSVANTVGMDIPNPMTPLTVDPRWNFQPPFNTVSHERDPGRVNLNTVVGRRVLDSNGVPRIWSEVYDGLMHRSQIYDPGPSPSTTERLIAGDGHTVDANGSLLQLSHFGPAWRDVVLSRKGYAQFNADDPGFDFPIEKPAPGAPPDVFTFGLSRGFPTLFANPFRSPDAGDLVPLRQMQQHGVDASLLRVHPRTRGEDRGWGIGTVDAPGSDDNADGLPNDMREAGFGDDEISHRGPNDYRAIPEEEFDDRDREGFPLFSETTLASAIDATRNPYMMYQPMSRLSSLATTRSNVFAVWVTVGYFEVEPAPDWSDEAVRERFGATTDDTDPETIYGRTLYDRVYPEGYMLGQEVGSDTGDVKRQRAFYIIDRTEPVGFKPGVDLNAARAIRVRRRIE